MTYRVVDEMLTQQMTGAVRPPAAEHLGLKLVQFGRGVAVYELTLRRQVCTPTGAVASGVLTTLAEAAMTAAAATTVADGHEGSLLPREIRARFDGTVDGDEQAPLRAEAVVMCTEPGAVRVEAEVHCDGRRIATFDAVYGPERGQVRDLPPLSRSGAAGRPLAEV